jgi:hypothetical protein
MSGWIFYTSVYLYHEDRRCANIYLSVGFEYKEVDAVAGNLEIKIN